MQLCYLLGKQQIPITFSTRPFELSILSAQVMTPSVNYDDTHDNDEVVAGVRIDNRS